MPNPSFFANYNTSVNAWSIGAEPLATTSTTDNDSYEARFRNYHFADNLADWSLEVTDHALEEQAEHFRRYLIKVFGSNNIDTNTVKVNRRKIDVELDDMCINEMLQAVDILIKNKKDILRRITNDINIFIENSREAPSSALEQRQEHVKYLRKQFSDNEKEIGNLQKFKERLLIKNQTMEVLNFEKNVFKKCYNLIYEKLTADYDILEYYPSLYRTKKEKNNKILGKFSDLGREDYDIRLTAI